MNLNKEEKEELKFLIESVLQKIYQEDIELILRGGMEQSLQFRFGLYLYELIKNIDWLKKLDIDLEYNKNGVLKKRTLRKPNGVRPDLIIHRRGNNDENILVLEFKGWWNNYPRESDIIKLEDFVNQNGEYKYGIGVLVELNQDIPVIHYF